VRPVFIGWMLPVRQAQKRFVDERGCVERPRLAFPPQVSRREGKHEGSLQRMGLAISYLAAPTHPHFYLRENASNLAGSTQNCAEKIIRHDGAALLRFFAVEPPT
jgi:hypothetical protein